MAPTLRRGDPRSPLTPRAPIRGLPTLALILFLLAATACVAPPPLAPSPASPLAAPSPTPGPLALTIVHSNDTWGYVDPCG